MDVSCYNKERLCEILCEIKLLARLCPESPMWEHGYYLYSQYDMFQGVMRLTLPPI